MDFRQIDAFVQVVKYRSFSKAADAVFLTQPTISSHISSLENELGVKLIDRSGKEIVPTKAGKIFLDYANNLINVRDNAIHTLSEFTNKLEGHLDIAASTVPGQYIMPELIKAFLKKVPKVNFSVLHMDSNQVIEELLEKNIELGIVGTKIENSKLEYKTLTDDKLVLITPNSRRFAELHTDSIPIDYLTGENFIFRESGSGTRKEFEKILKQNNLDLKSINIVAQMSSTEAIKQSVSMGLGLSVVSYISVVDYIKFGEIKAFSIQDLDLKREFYVVYQRNRPLSPISSAFIEFALSYFK